MNNYRSDGRMRRFIPKIIISLFYLALLAIFLYLPRMFNYFDDGSKALNIYSFVELISPDALELFRQRTGVNVSITYFESNEELYTKLRITGGEGYDLIVVSDYMVELLTRENLLHPLDRDKLANFDDLDKRLLNRFFDPANKYSIPYVWNPYGMLFDKTLFPDNSEVLSLRHIFQDPRKVWNAAYVGGKNFKLSMMNDAREAVCLAAIYLFGRVTHLSDEEYAGIKELLIRQKKWVESYASEGLQYLLMGNIVPLVYGASMFMRNTLIYSDRFDFAIPQEGSLFVIENLVVPRASNKKDLVYRLINFLTEPDIALISASAYGYNPTNRHTYEKLDRQIYYNKNFFPQGKQFDTLHLIHNDLSLQHIEDIWLAVKSA